MKKSELFFSALQVPVDFIMLVLAAISAFIIRDIPQLLALKPKLYAFPLEDYLKVVLIVTPFFLIIYALEGLYVIKSTRKFWQEALKVFMATAVGFMAIIITIFLKREWFSSRFIILASWMFGFGYVFLGRLILQTIQKWLLIFKGIGVHRLLLIGSGSKIYQFKKIIKANPGMGYQVIGQLETASVVALKKIKEEKGVDELVVCDPTLTDAEQEKLIDYCVINNIVYQYMPTTLQTSRVEMRMINGDPIIRVEPTPLEGWGRIIKRTFDLVGSVFLIVLFSPIMLLTALAIWLETGGPIIYRNERIGDDGKKFLVYKFRYMKWEYCVTRENDNLEKALDYEKELIKEKSVRTGPLYKIKDDPRKTRVGRFIEKYSIDELPQFFNVLKGEMSLVGPRPHQKREVDKYKEYHRRLLTIKPGVTGMAQISGRSDLDFESEYLLDVYYIENWSLKLDILICLKTVGVLFRRRKNL